MGDAIRGPMPGRPCPMSPLRFVLEPPLTLYDPVPPPPGMFGFGLPLSMLMPLLIPFEGRPSRVVVELGFVNIDEDVVDGAGVEFAVVASSLGPFEFWKNFANFEPRPGAFAAALDDPTGAALDRPRLGRTSTSALACRPLTPLTDGFGLLALTCPFVKGGRVSRLGSIGECVAEV